MGKVWIESCEMQDMIYTSHITIQRHGHMLDLYAFSDNTSCVLMRSQKKELLQEMFRAIQIRIQTAPDVIIRCSEVYKDVIKKNPSLINE